MSRNISPIWHMKAGDKLFFPYATQKRIQSICRYYKKTRGNADFKTRRMVTKGQYGTMVYCLKNDAKDIG